MAPHPTHARARAVHAYIPAALPSPTRAAAMYVRMHTVSACVYRMHARTQQLRGSVCVRSAHNPHPHPHPHPTREASWARGHHTVAYHHITSHHITSHHITSHHTTPHYITSHRTTLHHVTARCGTLHVTHASSGEDTPPPRTCTLSDGDSTAVAAAPGLHPSLLPPPPPPPPLARPPSPSSSVSSSSSSRRCA